MRVLSSEQLAYVRKTRVGRLATVNEDNSTQVVPIVYVNSAERIYFVVDRKKKSGSQLKRIKNILRTGKASLLLDSYSEDWENLSFLLLYCAAAVIGPGEGAKEKDLVARKLKKKYPQYSQSVYYPKTNDQAVFVRLKPRRAIFWQNQR
jgi:PPOX class probable F420-dependent enzyme